MNICNSVQTEKKITLFLKSILQKEIKVEKDYIVKKDLNKIH